MGALSTGASVFHEVWKNDFLPWGKALVHSIYVGVSYLGMHLFFLVPNKESLRRMVESPHCTCICSYLYTHF